MIVLTKEQMYEMDNTTIKILGIPSQVLMENAAKGSVDKILEICNKSNYTILCGSGNNGGDGLAIARWLNFFSKNVQILLLGSKNKMSPETKINYQLCQNLKIPIHKVEKLTPDLELIITGSDIIIDSIFGIGFSGELREPISSIISFCNKIDSIRVAIDIPTGLNADNGVTHLAFKADNTLTMAAFKCGHFLEKGKLYSGKVEVIPIGIPNQIKENRSPKLEIITEKNLDFPKRDLTSHKGSFGRLGIIAGSIGLTGAAILSAKASIRSGAGLVTLIHPENVDNVFTTQLIEVMQRSYNSKNIRGLLAELDSYDSILIGPGLGDSNLAKTLVKFVLENYKKPIIIDADAINIISRDTALINFLDERIILTPHLGEFSRLIGKSISEIQDRWLELVTNFVKRTKVNLVLKSSTSIIANEDNIYLNINGNDGLSTGGSGDVLAGIIAGLTVQNNSLINNCKLGCYELGKTAEKLAKIRETRSIIPSDIIENIFTLSHSHQQIRK